MAWTTVRKCSMNFKGHDEKVTVEIGLFCLQPLFIILELAPMLVTHQFFKIRSSTLAAVMWISDVLGQPSLSSWMSVWPFLNTLHHFLTCCTPVIPSPYTSMNCREFQCGERVPTIKAESHHELWVTKFTMSLPLHIKLPSTWHVTVSCAICFTLPLLYILH